MYRPREAGRKLDCELRKQDQKHFSTSRFDEAPWYSIFDLLAWRNFNTAGLDENISKEEARAVAILARCYRIPTIYAIIRPKEEMLYCSDEAVNQYWSQGCNITRAQWSPPSPSISLNSLFLLLRDIPLPSKDTEKQAEFTIRLSRWRNSPKPAQETPKDETRPENPPLAASTTSVVVMDRFLKANEDDLWFTRDGRSLYLATVGRMVQLYVNNGDNMDPLFLDTLRWRFESLLLYEDGHPMSDIPCLSRPLLYSKVFEKDETEYSSLHSDFTLLLARNLKFFSGAERVRRVKEVLTMMWVSLGALGSFDRIRERQGMESFFDGNRNILNRWVRMLDYVPHSHEILEHLSHAQGEQPDIGSLWRTVNSQETLSDLLPALGALESVISLGITPKQHVVLIELVCQDIELSPLGAFRIAVDSYQFQRAKALRDPCLRFIGTLAAGAEVEFPEDTRLFKASWIRIAKHLMVHYDGTDSPIVLKLQASAWFLVPNYTEELCRRALRETEALARVNRIFDYPVQCHEEGHEEGHDIGEGHLLLHILRRIHMSGFPVNIPLLTEFPMEGYHLYSTLAVLILSDGHEELLREGMHRQAVDERCADQLLEMVSMLLSSQYSMLAMLSTTPAHLMGYTRDLVGFSICVNKALNLPNDQRAASLILPVVSRAQVLIDALKHRSAIQQAIARREATKTIERLYALLERWRFSNSRILSCVRATGSFDRFIG